MKSIDRKKKSMYKMIKENYNAVQHQICLMIAMCV